MSQYQSLLESNPLFTTYQHLQTQAQPSLIKDYPIIGTIEFPEGYRETHNGEILAPSNTPQSQEYDYNKMMNDMASTHSEPVQEQRNYTVRQDLQGSKKRAMEFFQAKGLSPHQAAGIIGNLMGESRLNPEAINPTSKAFGIAQWLGDRKKKLFAKYGEKPTFDQQLEFLWDELNTTEKNAFNKLLQTTSVEEATNSFMKHFERPSQREMAQSISNRIKYGKELFSKE